MLHFCLESCTAYVLHSVTSSLLCTSDTDTPHRQVTNDVSEFTCANFLQPGEKTPVAARLSTVTHEKGCVLSWSC